MKSMGLKKAIALSLLVGANGYAVASEHVSLLDYTETSSSYEDAYLTGNFNLKDGNQDQSSYNLNLGVDYDKVVSTPNRTTKFAVDAAGSRSRSGEANADDESNYLATTSLTSDQYFNPASNDLFWYGRGELGFKKSQVDPFSKITGGIGYGRVVNVTPMAKAIRLVEAVNDRGVLNRLPSVATYNKIAGIINKENEYKSRYGHEDYYIKWISDIEAVLVASGVAKNGKSLGAGGVLKAYDVLDSENISTRKHGWLVRGGLGVVLSDYDGESGKPAYEIGAEYHKPFNNKTQFSDEVIVTGTLDDGNNGYSVTNDMSLTYELTDKIDWINKWQMNYSDSDDSDELTSHALSSTFSYELNNQLDFDVVASLSDSGEDGTDWDKQLNMGITYRLR